MASWPSSLPAPRRSDYALESGDPTVRTDMDVGAARVRRRTRSVPDHITLSVQLDETQMALFRTTWDNDFCNGAAWVYMPIKDGYSAGLVSRECRPVGGKFKAAPLSAAYWSVSFEVEVRHA